MPTSINPTPRSLQEEESPLAGAQATYHILVDHSIFGDSTRLDSAYCWWRAMASS